MAGRKGSRGPLNRHLYLRSGTWWTRIIHDGIENRRSTDCPKSEIVAAREIRDKRLAQIAERGEGIERLPDPLLLGELIDLYFREECRQYDRDAGGYQPGTKRSASTDGYSNKRIMAHLPANLSSASVNRERLLDFARAIEKEDPQPSPGTRRKAVALLRRIFSWGIEHPSKTGLSRTPFAELRREDRRRLFPRVPKRGYLYSAEELRGMYESLPSHLIPFVRFGVHTGMRLREITTLTWGNVDLEHRVARVEARFAKNGQPREVALGEVACSVLFAFRPADPAADAQVFLGRRGAPIRDVRNGFDAAVSKVWKPRNPEQPKPRFHDLRKTGATRVEAVSSKAVAKTFLGHADEDVTDTYIVPDLDLVRDAVNRAAFTIDGTTLPGVVRLEPRMAQKMAQQPESDAEAARGRS